MKLLYGTGNPAKLSAMQRRLAPLGIELFGLRDLPRWLHGTDNLEERMPQIDEDGITPLENAVKKAQAYYEAFHVPVFSCDSGLYIDNIPEEKQPGVHVRTVNGKYLNDDEMLAHYIGLAKEYGDLHARYRNAICLVMDAEHVYQGMEESMASAPFLITAVPHSGIRKKGFPLDSISLDMKTGKYYYDLAGDELDRVAVEDGFLKFFENVLQNYRQ